MKLKFTFVFLAMTAVFMFSSPTASAENCDLTVNVFKADSGEPIGGATVSISPAVGLQASQSATTNSNGSVRFVVMCGGWDIVVEAPLHTPGFDNVFIPPDTVGAAQIGLLDLYDPPDPDDPPPKD